MIEELKKLQQTFYFENEFLKRQHDLEIQEIKITYDKKELKNIKANTNNIYERIITNLIIFLGSIAWPITVLIIIFNLKNHIFKLLEQTKKIKFKDWELEFEKDLNNLNARVKEMKKETKIPKDFINKYFNGNLDGIPLRSKIIESWLNLETSIMSSVTSFMLPPNTRRLNFQEALKILHTHEILDEENLKVIKELRALRNKIVHSMELNLTEEETEKFIETTRDQADIILSNVFNKFVGCSQ